MADIVFPPYFPLDEYAGVVCLEVPTSQVVLLQAYFELSEGIGAVRTVDLSRSRILVMLSKDSYQPACELLASIQGNVAWKAVVMSKDDVPEEFR